MAKSASFTCANCGAVHSKWSGRCDDCGAWNTISEDAPLSSGPTAKGLGAARGQAVPLTDLSADDAPRPRTTSNLAGHCWIALFVWELFIAAHILRHALDMRLIAGFFIAIAYVFFEFQVMYVAHRALSHVLA